MVFPSTAPVAVAGRVAFLADADLTGENPDHGWELFLLDDDGPRQLTTSPGGDAVDPALNLVLSADRAGRRFAFASSADLAGDNADRSREIFLVGDRGGIVQLTHSTGGGAYCGGNVQPALTGDGARVIFASDLDLTPGPSGNSDGNCELFAIGSDGQGLVQLTSGRSALGAVNPSVSDDGRRIAFASDEDLAGDNPDGNVEIFLLDLGRGDAPSAGHTPRQLTRSTGGFYGFLGNFYPRLSADGGRVVFLSGRDLGGDNPDHNAELFTLATDGDAPAVQLTVSVTDGGGEPRLDNYFPALSADGRRVAFTSTVDLGLGAPSPGTDLYVADADGRNLVRITAATGPSDWPALDEHGERLVFLSQSDFASGNPDGAGALFVAALGW